MEFTGMEISYLSRIIMVFAMWCAYKLINRRRRTLSIENRSVFISGCDSGIGFHLALHLHAIGFNIFAGCLSTDSDGARQLREKDSDRLIIVQLDITDEASVRQAVARVDEQLRSCNSRLWALINNAGICVFGEFDWLTWKQCSSQVSVNLLGTIRLTKQFLPLLKKSSGRIITLTSVNGLFAYPGLSMYCATKFALEGFCDALRNELHKFGVRVIVIVPGDFAKITNIMSNHRKNANEMWNEMSSENKKMYRGYFQRYHDSATKHAGIGSPASFESSSITNDVERSLLEIHPKPRVISSTFQIYLFISVIRLLPTFVADKLLRFIISKSFGLEWPFKNTDES